MSRHSIVSVELIALAICSFIAIGVCLPIMLYRFCKTYQYRKQSFIRSRHPSLLFFNCILSCLCIIERVVALSYDFQLSHLYKNELMRNTIYVLIFGLYIHSYLLRHWLIFYDLGYREAQVNILWERELNVAAIAQSKWFIEHRTNLGNTRFMMCVAFFLYIFVIIALLLLHYFHSAILWSIGISIYGIILAVTFLTISYKISTINKSVKMKKEICYAGIMLFICAIFYSIIILNVFNMHIIIIIILTFVISTAIPVLLSLMSLPQKQKIKTTSTDDYFDRLPQKKLDLRQILKNTDGFKLFIRHLIKDLCVENLIYLSYVIQFKRLYSFLVQKELEDKKTRSGIIEEDEYSDGDDDSDHEHDAYDDIQEYEALYGWNMELPTRIMHKSQAKIQVPRKEELLNTMYGESLNIYNRFIRVSSHDEVNISGKMRKSLKKYFEIEQIVEKTQNGLLPGLTTTLQNVTASMQSHNKSNSKQLKIKRSTNSHSNSLNFPNLPGQLTGSGASANYSNDSMNIRLTDCNEHVEVGMDEEHSPVPDINDEQVDIIFDGASGKGIQLEVVNINAENDEHQRSESGMRRLSALSERFKAKNLRSRRTRKEKTQKTRFIIAQTANDNYLKLDWIQRFKIFDRSCDSIEKLLRIDSYGKFRESPEYLMFCDQLRKKSVSKSNIFRRKQSHGIV